MRFRRYMDVTLTAIAILAICACDMAGGDQARSEPDSRVSRFAQSLQSEAVASVINDLEEGAPEESAPGLALTSQLNHIRAHSRFPELLSAIHATGFADERDWASVGDKIACVFIGMSDDRYFDDVSQALEEAEREIPAEQLTSEVTMELRKQRQALEECRTARKAYEGPVRDNQNVLSEFFSWESTR